MSRPLHVGRQEEKDIERVRRNQAGSGFDFRGSVRLVEGRPEVRIDSRTLERSADGTISVKPRVREKIEPLVDYTGSSTLNLNELPELADLTGAPSQANINAAFATLRESVSTLTAKVNELIQRKD